MAEGNEISGLEFLNRVLSVAPLKHLPCVDFALGPLLFPRSFERGSIEASVGTSGAASDAAFPRSFERGSIEASKIVLTTAHLDQFPRSFERRVFS